MDHIKSIADLRREYGELTLDEKNLPANPLEQFNQWMVDILKMEESIDPTAMVLSTVDKYGCPDSRVVLLKGIEADKFIFYTNYHSDKGEQIKANPQAALNFYWPHLSRQVRVKGRVEKSSAARSNQYFQSRPLESRLGALISPQSKPIPDREFLEQAFNRLNHATDRQVIQRPKHWGGYELEPTYIEFWQGRDNRLHDRIAYCRQDTEWIHYRLAP